MDELKIRQFTGGDWEAMSLIYQEGIATGQATFETETHHGPTGTRITFACPDW